MSGIAVIAFTEQGCRLACRLADGLRASENGAHEVSVAGPARFAEACGVDAYESLAIWTRESFAARDALVFVSATGIAVRAIAPFVKDKFHDPAVVSVDECGLFAVPLLSGHVGGANDLARQVALILGAQPVISTATDVNGLFAVDEWAREQGLAICERAIAKEISAALLAGEAVGFASDFPVEGTVPAGVVLLAGQAQDEAGETDRAVTPSQDADSPHLGFHVTCDESSQPFDRTLHLVPRIVTVGAGYHRDQPTEDLRTCIDVALAQANVSPRAVSILSSINLKADEPAFREIAESTGWQLRFYTAEQLNAVPGDFESSEFVRSVTGTDNVCERAALAEGGTLLQGKTKAEGATAAVALRAGFAVRFDASRD
ncbi:MAG: cobalamin biosynthesis protein [Eggerthellaceae bacterium]|nr:cobalamin biosynthesis protein [Eggerthellaceae bacterium]